MPDDYSDELTHLLILKKAYRLLIATNQCDSAADLLIAQQTLNVLTHGTRHALRDEDFPPVDFKFTDEVLNAPPAHPCAAPAEDHEPHVETGDGYDAYDFPGYDAIKMQGEYTILFPTDTPAPASVFASLPPPTEQPACDGFTIPERVSQLGFCLRLDEQAAHLPRLTKMAREAYALQFNREPDHTDGGDWYGVSEAKWLDVLITGYLGQFRTGTQVPGAGR